LVGGLGRIAESYRFERHRAHRQELAVTFDLASARGWVAQNQVFAEKYRRKGDLAGAEYFADQAATEQAKINALIEAKALARELAECDGPIADDGARLWFLLDTIIPEVDLVDFIEVDVVDEEAQPRSPPDR
jgi:hypothetical protein